MGLRNGNAVINISNPTTPVIVGHIPGVSSQWHEVCVLGDYAYACTEGGGGIQIIDLRQVDQGIVTLAATYTGNGVSTGHTIQAIPNTKLVLINGGNMPPVNGQTINGLRALDCQNPAQPVEVGKWQGKYVHDAIYHTYTTGPNAGKTICFAFCGTGATGGMYIIDVTATQNAQGQNVPAMTQLGYIRYFPNSTNFYSHSGSLSPDGRYIYANDEFDEGNALVTDCTTHIIDVQDLTNPTYAGAFLNPIGAIDHNSMVQDGHLFLSAYKSGLRVYNLANPAQLKESGFFDTFDGSGFQYQGAWGTWAGFPSGNVIISDINAGFFVVDPSEAKGLGAPITGISYWNIQDPGDGIKRVRLIDDNPLVASFSGEIATATVTFETDSLARNKVDFTVRVSSRADREERLRLYAKNMLTGAEVLIGEIQTRAGYKEFGVSNLDGATYISATKTIQLRAEIVRHVKGPGSLDIDLIKAYVHN